VIKKGAKSDPLREGAHHVFRKQKEDGCEDALTTLIDVLDSSTAPESMPAAAYDLLKRLKGKP
jgi:hypothetical protein